MQTKEEEKTKKQTLLDAKKPLNLRQWVNNSGESNKNGGEKGKKEKTSSAKTEKGIARGNGSTIRNRQQQTNKKRHKNGNLVQSQTIFC